MSAKPSLPVSVATCLARSPKTLQQCPAAAEEGSKWCARHEEHEGKQLKIYKRITSDYHEFDDSVLCLDVKKILACTDAETLKAWHAGAKAKWKLGHRYVTCRIRVAILYRRADRFQDLESSGATSCFVLRWRRSRASAIYINSVRAANLRMGEYFISPIPKVH